jgi:hypothetical protein
MNAKFKMPKFGRDISGKGWFKELLLTFLGTTISIVLTFGTAQYFEQKQKNADARLLAMMVIHDMDNTVELLRRLAKEDAKESKFETDASNVTAKPGMEKQTNYFVEDYKAYTKDCERKFNESEFVKKYAISIDKSGTKIEMVPTKMGNDGKVNKENFYMTKEDK